MEINANPCVLTSKSTKYVSVKNMRIIGTISQSQKIFPK